MAWLHADCSLRSQRPYIRTNTSRAAYSTSEGGSFGVKGISRDKHTGEIVSKPHLHKNDELASDLAAQIIERLQSKAGKGYAVGTALVINCIANGIILSSEWNDAVDRVTEAQVHLAFEELFLIEMVMSHSATLFGHRPRRKRN